MSRKPHTTYRPRAANNSAAAATAVSAPPPHKGRRMSRNGKVIRFGMPAPQAPGENDNELTELFGVEPFLRNQLSKTNLDHLRARIDSEGLSQVADSLEVAPQTLLYVCAGFGHRLRPITANKFRDYFGMVAKK